MSDGDIRISIDETSEPDKGDGWEQVSQTANGWHEGDPTEQPPQDPVDLGASVDG